LGNNVIWFDTTSRRIHLETSFGSAGDWVESKDSDISENIEFILVHVTDLLGTYEKPYAADRFTALEKALKAKEATARPRVLLYTGKSETSENKRIIQTGSSRLVGSDWAVEPKFNIQRSKRGVHSLTETIKSEVDSLAVGAVARQEINDGKRQDPLYEFDQAADVECAIRLAAEIAAWLRMPHKVPSDMESLRQRLRTKQGDKGEKLLTAVIEWCPEVDKSQLGAQVNAQVTTLMATRVETWTRAGMLAPSVESKIE